MPASSKLIGLFLALNSVLQTAGAEAQKPDTGKQNKADVQAKPGLTVSRQTTFFTGPLGESGQVDYPGAINRRLGQGVTAQNNANVLFWQALGPAPNKTKMPPRFFSLMGMDQPPEPGHEFLDLSQYLQQVKQIPRGEPGYDEALDHQSQAAVRTWRTGQHPQVLAWLKASEKPLALVVAGTKRAKYFSPLVIPDGVTGADATLVSVLLPAVQQSRSFARALTARAMWHAGEGRNAEAWQDLLACHRLARLIGQGPTLIEGLVGFAIDSFATRTDLAFLESVRPGAEQTRMYLADLANLPPLPVLADKIDVTERCFFLDIAQMLATQGKADDIGQLFGMDDKAGKRIARLAASTMDWNATMRFGNGWYDRLVEAMRIEDRQDREQAFGKITQDLKKLGDEARSVSQSFRLLLGNPETRGKAMGSMLIMIVLPAVAQAQIAEDQATQRHSSLRIAFALAGYRSQHGAYPETLDQLTPEFLKQVPEDLFAEKPLRYRRAGDGYLLYSIGANAKDEGGQSASDDPRGDDLPVRMPLPPAGD